MQEKIQIGEATTIQVTRAFRIDWTLLIAMLFILAIAYFLYSRRGRKMNWKKFITALIIGIVFAFIAFILTGDISSIIIGLLIIYLELRFGEGIFKERRSKK